MSTPEIITVNSEALEAQIRDLLPSQSGFGSELQASNVIMPIIDLTATAEGSGLGNDLQTALSFGSQTVFNVNNTTTTLANSTGFWRITAISSIIANNISGGSGTLFTLSDGLSNKIIYEHNIVQTTAAYSSQIQYDFVVFLNSGESLTVTSNNANANIDGSYRQIATVTGELVNPAGFVAE